MIETIRILVQFLIALGIFNVWLIRFGKSTQWRGGDAQDMRAEFEVYGLPGWFMILIGISKVILACCLIAGFWFPAITRPAAMGLAALMLGAVSMHIKVGDPIMKSLPATSMLAMSLFVAFG
jgi:uncharacterized membrane protein YphA (DoxX/SURF4 family)